MKSCGNQKKFDTHLNFVLKILFYFTLNFNSLKNPLEGKKLLKSINNLYAKSQAV